ncbi:MAG: azurin [Pseudomonas sp.]|uniref:azurin n=1 Tax=Pseudomonas sp. TaxID=306 RepID=UPI0033991CC0
MLRKLIVASVLGLAAAPLWAAECAVEIDSTDQMTYTSNAMTVSKSCKTFTVTLKHVGKLPKNVMGHNWVLSKTADAAAIASDGMAAGIDNNYLKPGDTRVLAFTPLIGGGETTSVSFDVAKLTGSEPYQFFCSFPGHVSLMKGTLTLVD